MTLYSLVLFVHITAVLALSATLSSEALSLFRLKRASSLSQAQRWMEPLPGLRWIAISSLIFILVSGIYLTVQMSAFSLAWPKVTIAALLFIAPLGAISDRRMRAIRRLCTDTKTLNPELLRRLRDPSLKISLGARTGIFLGIVLLMAAKPQLWVAVGIVAASPILGILSSVLLSRKQPESPAASAPVADQMDKS
jgi:hypothetical protein